VAVGIDIKLEIPLGQLGGGTFKIHLQRIFEGAFDPKLEILLAIKRAAHTETD